MSTIRQRIATEAEVLGFIPAGPSAHDDAIHYYIAGHPSDIMTKTNDLAELVLTLAPRSTVTLRMGYYTASPPSAFANIFVYDSILEPTFAQPPR